MTVHSTAFKRIGQMTEGDLKESICSLERDLHVKQDKAKRLSQDIARHNNILEAARRELTQRKLSET